MSPGDRKITSHLSLKVKVRPRSPFSKVEIVGQGEVLVSVKAAPERGQANKELIRLLADHFHVPRQAVIIISGASSPWKRVVVQGIEATGRLARGGKK